MTAHRAIRSGRAWIWDCVGEGRRRAGIGWPARAAGAARAGLRGRTGLLRHGGGCRLDAALDLRDLLSKRLGEVVHSTPRGFGALEAGAHLVHLGSD